MSTFVMLCGGHGCGKTTLAKEIEKEDFIRVAAEDIRQTLDKHVDAHKRKYQTYSLMKADILFGLARGCNVVCDAMNLKSKYRIEILNAVKQLNMDIETFCLYFDVPLDTCLKRTVGKTPARFVRKSYEDFEVPTYKEGWDVIGVLSPKE